MEKKEFQLVGYDNVEINYVDEQGVGSSYKNSPNIS
jgi:hypothetical protein